MIWVFLSSFHHLYAMLIKLRVVWLEIFWSISKIMIFSHQSFGILHWVGKQIVLFEKLKRSWYFIKSYWPVLPFLVFLWIGNIFIFNQIKSPSVANQNRVTSQRIDKFLIFAQYIIVWRKDFVLIPIAASPIKWKSPPVIVRMVNGCIAFLLI